MSGRVTDQKVSEDPAIIVAEDEAENNLSNWQSVEECSERTEFANTENPFEDRRVGVSKTVQERQEKEGLCWWKTAKCPSCNKGFTCRSKEKQCHSSDRYTHVKKQCLVM